MRGVGILKASAVAGKLPALYQGTVRSTALERGWPASGRSPASWAGIHTRDQWCISCADILLAPDPQVLSQVLPAGGTAPAVAFQ